MIYFFYGDDTFRSRRKLAEFIEKFKSAQGSDVNLNRFVAPDFDVTQFLEGTLSIGFFSSKRLIIVENALSEGNAEFQEKIAEKLAKPIVERKALADEYNRMKGKKKKSTKPMKGIKKENAGKDEHIPHDSYELNKCYAKLESVKEGYAGQKFVKALGELYEVKQNSDSDISVKGKVRELGQILILKKIATLADEQLEELFDDQDIHWSLQGRYIELYKTAVNTAKKPTNPKYTSKRRAAEEE